MANFLSAVVLALVASGLVVTVQCDNSEVTTEITGSQVERDTLPLGFNLEYRGLGPPASILPDSGCNGCESAISSSPVLASNSLPGLTQVTTGDTSAPTVATGLTSPTETAGQPILTSTVDHSAAIAMQEGGTSIDSGSGFSSLTNGPSLEGSSEGETLTSSGSSLETVATPYSTLPAPTSKTMNDGEKSKDSAVSTPSPVPLDMASEKKSSDSTMKKAQKSVNMAGSNSEEDDKMKGSGSSVKDEDEKDEKEKVKEKEKKDDMEGKSKSSGSRKLLL